MFMAELDSPTGDKGESDPTPPIPSPLPRHQSSITLECTDLSGLDDPFLAEFTDIDMLLQDTNLINPSSPSTPTPSDSDLSPVNYNSPLKLSSVPQDSTPSFPVVSSPVGGDDLTFSFSDDLLDYPVISPLPQSQETVQPDNVCSMDTGSVVSPRKRQASEDTEPSNTEVMTKKPKLIVKNEKYFQRRNKNNIASQVSRAKRRAKQTSLFDREVELTKENEQLRKRVQEMTAEAQRLKKLLIDRLAQ